MKLSKIVCVVGASLITLVRTEATWAYVHFCPTASPSYNAAYVYDGANCATFQDGDEFPDLSTIGWNERISSINIGSGVRVVLYEHANFGGRQAHYDGGWGHYDSLGNVNDRTSSIEVYGMQGGPAAAWYLGDYPKNRENFWSHEAQGLANDGIN
jgi:hypothetical protein